MKNEPLPQYIISIYQYTHKNIYGLIHPMRQNREKSPRRMNCKSHGSQMAHRRSKQFPACKDRLHETIGRSLRRTRVPCSCIWSVYMRVQGSIVQIKSDARPFKSPCMQENAIRSWEPVQTMQMSQQQWLHQQLPTRGRWQCVTVSCYRMQ